LAIIGGKTAVTAKDGKFTVRDIPGAQTQPITISKTGYRTYDQAELPLNVQQPLQIALDFVGNDAYGTVKGKLLDDKTGKGIGRAEVKVGFIFGGEVLDWFTGHTTEDGLFQISGVPVGQARVEVDLAGYAPFTQDILVITGDQTPELTLRLVAQETSVAVSGSVFDVEERTPVPGATVAVEGKQQITDGNGTFSFTAVASGARVFSVAANGYETAQRNVDVEPGMAPLQIGIARVGSGPPTPPYSLTGTVTLADQADASGVTVEATEEASGLVMDTAVSDQTAHYFLWIPAGSYVVTASKSGYQNTSQRTSLLPGEIKTLDILLSRARH
jgi:hypothetical protein